MPIGCSPLRPKAHPPCRCGAGRPHKLEAPPPRLFRFKWRGPQKENQRKSAPCHPPESLGLSFSPNFRILKTHHQKKKSDPTDQTREACITRTASFSSRSRPACTSSSKGRPQLARTAEIKSPAPSRWLLETSPRSFFLPFLPRPLYFRRSLRNMCGATTDLRLGG